MEELRFKEIRVVAVGTSKGDEIELFGLTVEGKVFRYGWKTEEWIPLSMKSG